MPKKKKEPETPKQQKIEELELLESKLLIGIALVGHTVPQQHIHATVKKILEINILILKEKGLI